MTAAPFLIQLRVENLLLIEQAELALTPGLNVITGETGAGKTMLARALDLLLGARQIKNVVRPGCKEAYLEGLFHIPAGWLARFRGTEVEEVLEVDHDDPCELALARRISAQGRSRCLVNGRTVTLEVLRTLSADLLAFYGQHEQRNLMLDQHQARLLDRSGDAQGLKLFAAYTEARAEMLQAARELEQLEREQRLSEREVELARFELEELLSADLKPGEEQQLAEELAQLSEAGEGQLAAAGAQQLLRGSDLGDQPAALDLLDQAIARLAHLNAPRARELAERLEQVRVELDELARELSELADSWEADPQRQAEVEQRLQLIHRLCHKHRCSFQQLFERRAELERQVTSVDTLPERLEAARTRLDDAIRSTEAAAQKLSGWRAEQARRLAQAVTESLASLAMEGAIFSIQLEALRGGPLERLGEQGAERVVFMLQANPGIAAEPLAEVASGGELSRLMLSLTSHCPLNQDGLLVLDEPDSGLGGHTAHGVAERLALLAQSRQVLVISHLPQIAARADCHFVIEKHLHDAATSAQIRRLDTPQQRVEELCRMAGHNADDPAARQIAEQLLNAA